MQVFRIERPDGVGPYISCNRSEDLESLTLSHDMDLDRWPTPSEDVFGGNRYIHADEKCGFVSMKQLLSWFGPDDINVLDSDGFKINVLPQAIASGIVQSGTIAGKLKGVIEHTTPRAWRVL